jgi:hypothetical protein
MRITLILIASLALAPAAIAEVYKWVDSNGKVHYGDTPPANARATPIEMTSSGPSRAGQIPATAAAEQASQPPAQPPIQVSFAPEMPAQQPATRGMDFGVYIMLRLGMSEGELLQRAGPPDFQTNDGSVVGKARRIDHRSGNRVRGPGVHTFNNLELKRYYYYPTVSNPFTTVLTLTGGMISDLQRTRQF